MAGEENDRQPRRLGNPRWSPGRSGPAAERRAPDSPVHRALARAGRLGAREDLDREPDRPDEVPESLADGLVVVDDEDDGLLGRHRIPGRAKWKVAPWSAFGVAHSRPPCASMIERLIDSPMPMPPGLVVKKALEELVHLVRVDPDAGVLHGHQT